MFSAWRRRPPGEMASTHTPRRRTAIGVLGSIIRNSHRAAAHIGRQLTCIPAACDQLRMGSIARASPLLPVENTSVSVMLRHGEMRITITPCRARHAHRAVEIRSRFARCRSSRDCSRQQHDISPADALGPSNDIAARAKAQCRP